MYPTRADALRVAPIIASSALVLPYANLEDVPL
jgi:hypothetical protein